MNLNSKIHVYRGFGNTFDKNEGGIPPAYTDIELIEKSIMQIMMTPKGSRVMRPDFGSNLLHIVFENDRDFIESEIESEIIEAIENSEPRVKIEPNDIETIFDDDSVIVTVSFRFLNEVGKVEKKFILM